MLQMQKMLLLEGNEEDSSVNEIDVTGERTMFMGKRLKKKKKASKTNKPSSFM